MRGQLYHGFVQVVQWSVHWAPSLTTRVLVLAGGTRRCALETCGKKNASSAFRLGLIYILDLTVLQNVYEHVFLRIKIFPNLLAFFVSKGKRWHFHIGFLTQDLLCMRTKLNHFMHNVHLQGKPETVSRGIQINMDLVSYLRAYELHHLCCNPLTNTYWILIRATGCQGSRCSSVFPVIERETAERLTFFCLKGGTVLGPLKVWQPSYDEQNKFY